LPAGLAIVDEAFTEQNGLVNSTMKIVRGKVETHFADRLDYLYTPEGKNVQNERNLASLAKLLK
jgi:long-chain acyl-CoA synthetase